MRLMGHRWSCSVVSRGAYSDYDSIQWQDNNYYLLVTWRRSGTTNPQQPTTTKQWEKGGSLNLTDKFLFLFFSVFLLNMWGRYFMNDRHLVPFRLFARLKPRKEREKERDMGTWKRMRGILSPVLCCRSGARCFTGVWCTIFRMYRWDETGQRKR